MTPDNPAAIASPDLKRASLLFKIRRSFTKLNSPMPFSVRPLFCGLRITPSGRVFLALLFSGVMGPGFPPLHGQALQELPAARKEELLVRLTPVNEVLQLKDIPIIPGDDGINLLSERITIVDDTGKRTILRQVARKSLTEAGVKYTSDETIGFKKKDQTIHVLVAETIQPDGSRQTVKPQAILVQSPQRQADYSLYDDQAELKVIFPNVKPGSVTHLVYVVEDIVAKVPGEFTQSIIFSGGWAIGRLRYQLEIAPALAEKLRWETVGNGVPVPEVKKLSDGRSLYTWSVQSQRSRRYELNSPPILQVGPAVILGTFKSWDNIASWYRGLIAGRDQVDSVLAKAADEWTAGVDKPADIITALHRHVADQVRYVGLEFGEADYQPHNCNEVWENQYGDCKDKANLLVALLGRRGIHACIALVNTEHTGVVDRRVPTYQNFGHAIVAVEQPGSGWLFCDPTIAYSLPGILGPGSSDRDVLLIKETGAEWVHTPAVTAGITYQLSLKLAKTGELSGWFNRTAEGYYGASDREDMTSLDSENLNSTMTKTVRSFFSGADVIDVARGDAPAPAPFTVKGYFILPGKPATESNPYTLTFPSSPRLFADIGDRADRQTPFHTDRDLLRATATINLPAGWHPRKVPEPFNSESDVLTCRAHWNFKGDICTTEVTIETKQTLIKRLISEFTTTPCWTSRRGWLSRCC